jgi:hypothetical protein
MVTYFGMSKKLGNISFYDSSGQNEYNFSKPYSETTAQIIDQEVKAIVDGAFQQAKELLTKNKKGLTRLAELLLEKEVIFSEDLEKVFGSRKFKKNDMVLLKATPEQFKDGERAEVTAEENTNNIDKDTVPVDAEKKSIPEKDSE